MPSPFRVTYRLGRSAFAPVPRSAQCGNRSSARVRVDELPHVHEEVHASWRAAHERGKKTYAGVEVTFGQLVAHVGELARVQAPGHASDLYLAAACAMGLPAALRQVDEHIERMRPVVACVVRDFWAIDDVLQDVRCRLLVGPTSKIRSYRGSGTLPSWVRTIAVNVARDHVRAECVRRGRESSQPSSGLPDHPVEPDGEVARCIVHRGRASTCIEAVRLAFESLDAGERQLLRDYFLSDLSIDALGPRYLVNRATIARRIHRATDKVRDCLRKHLTSSYAREEPRMLDSIALTVCRDMLDTTKLLETTSQPASE